MNKKIIFIFVFSIILTGCGNLKENQIKNVEEVETKVSVLKPQKETEVPETLNGVDKEMVQFYIDDLHFYDEKDGVDFVCSEIEDEKYHVAILDAWRADTLAECGEYFVENSARFVKTNTLMKEDYSIKDEDTAYLCVKIQLTNLEDKQTQFDIAYFLPFIRVSDDRLVEYGLADKYLYSPFLHTEVCYDYAKKKNGTSYYFFDMQPGETTDAITIVYFIKKEDISGDWYLRLNGGKPKYNSKFQCNFPSDNEDTKFLKINLR